MKQTATAAARDRTFRRVVDLARRAPSVHNTQPWTWSIHGDALELHADRTRQLEAADPEGRNLVLSCGTALHHALVAARAQGWAPVVDTLPDPRDPDLLARIRLRPAEVPVDAAQWFEAIGARCTDRRRFTSWPIPDERLQRFSSVTRSLGATVVPILDPQKRQRLERLVDRAMEVQDQDLRVRMEERAWTGHSADDGLVDPVDVSWGGGHTRRRRTRFDHEAEPPAVRADIAVRPIESSDGLLVVVTEDDGRLSWLHAGEALSALWLEATTEGLSIVPLSQVVEVTETRISLDDLLGPGLRPQILLRVGWQEIGRRDLPRTPRRSLDEILRDQDCDITSLRRGQQLP
jgi:nitroreductase